MKNMNDKTKKGLVVASGLIISVVLIVMITGQFNTPPVEDVDIAQNSSQAQDVVVDTPDMTEEENTIHVPPIKIPEKTESSNGDDTGTAQTIQPDVPEKSTYTEEELTNPNQKPNGEKVDPSTEETPIPPQTQDKSQEKPSNATGGLPGFDNVPNAGENEVVDGVSDGDINKQVGSMGQ